MAHLKFTLSAGAAVRRQTIRALKELAFIHDAKLELEEDRGWFSSQYLCKFVGDDTAIRELSKAIPELLQDLGGEVER